MSLYINFKFTDGKVKATAKRRKKETKATGLTAYINSLIVADGEKKKKP